MGPGHFMCKQALSVPSKCIGDTVFSSPATLNLCLSKQLKHTLLLSDIVKCVNDL